MIPPALRPKQLNVQEMIIRMLKLFQPCSIEPVISQYDVKTFVPQASIAWPPNDRKNNF